MLTKFNVRKNSLNMQLGRCKAAMNSLDSTEFKMISARVNHRTTWNFKGHNFLQGILEVYRSYRWYKDVAADTTRTSRMNNRLRTHEPLDSRLCIQDTTVYWHNHHHRSMNLPTFRTAIECSIISLVRLVKCNIAEQRIHQVLCQGHRIAWATTAT